MEEIIRNATKVTTLALELHRIYRISFKEAEKIAFEIVAAGER